MGERSLVGWIRLVGLDEGLLHVVVLMGSDVTARASSARVAVEPASTPRGERTRQAILERAVDLASAEGLTGLSIGRLATDLSLSKAGLIGHFGSKEQLQLATIEAARSLFFASVVAPALAADEGLPRLLLLCERWLGYAQDESRRGGCFFTAVAAEFDGRPGPERDRFAEIMREWLNGLERAIADAQRLGHLDARADAAQLAFELHALEMAANWALQLFGDTGAPARARRGVLSRIDALKVEKKGKRASRRGAPRRAR